jgi:hypothetical protein
MTHPDVNNVSLEAESFLPTIYHGNLGFECFKKSSINLIVFKIYLLGSFKDNKHIVIIVVLLALTT